MFPMNEVIIVSSELAVIVVMYFTSFNVSGSAIGGGLLRRVPRKSVFIAPKIYRDECDDGYYSRSITKKCIEIIMPDQRGWENILLARLRDIEYDYDDEDKATSTSGRGEPHESNPIEKKSEELAASVVRSDESSESMEEVITWQEIKRVFDDTTSIIDDSDPTTVEEKSFEEETVSVL